MAKTTKSNRASGGTATIHDQKLDRGEGGELHQTASGKAAVLTTAQGGPVSDDQNSLKIGPRGPTLIEDFHFREKIFHFDHERIPERVVHARGYAAHGFFENYKSLSKYTRADLFQRAGEKTPAFVRFSTVAGSKGSVDLARDVRGFAVKLYTQEGNWDIVGNNIPVFFIQDAIKFPDLIHAVKEEPDCAFPQAQSAHDNFWDFISLTPESMHMVMWVMSDRAIPRSFRFMEGFGVHTFRLVNAKNESTFVKFHWKPKLGLQSVVWNEAVKINGADPDFHRRDLWTAIKTGNFPEWELQLQLFDQEFADSFDFDVLDPTKIIPEEILPPIPVGRLVLDRMPDNFFAETEQVAFMTQNVPPGIDFSNDPLLQGRNFSYLDTQLKRLGSPNFTHIPINAPKCPFAHFQQDGHMAMRNPVGRANYQPNSFGEGPRELPQRGFTPFADDRTRRQTPTACRKLRGPLQPGASVLHQSDHGRAGAHSCRSDVRTQQGQNARDPGAHGLASLEYRRDAGQQSRRQTGPAKDAETGRRRRANSPGSRSLPGPEHRRERTRSASRVESWVFSFPTDRMQVSSRRSKVPSTRPGPPMKSSRRRSPA